MKRNSLLTAGAALAIVGAAAVGGYFIDRMPSDQLRQILETPLPVATTAPVKPAQKAVAARRDTAPRLKPVSAASGVIPDRSLVALSGTVTGKKGNVITLADPRGQVRVVMREDVPRPRELANYVRASDRIDVGAPVTVYGRLRTTEDIPKVYADAVYDSSTRTLYKLNTVRDVDTFTSPGVTARYTPVDGAKAAKVRLTMAPDAR